MVNTTIYGVMINMNWIRYILLFLLITVILIILSEVKIHFLVHKEKKNDFIEINLWLFYNLLHIKKKIPMIALESPKEGVKYETDTTISNNKNNKSKKKHRVTPAETKKWHHNYKDLLANVQDFYGIITLFLRHVYIEKYRWETKIGVGEPMETGVLVGIAWSIKSSILGIVSKFVRLRGKPFVNINPDFDHELFQTHFECIVRFRVGNVILTGIRILTKYVKGGRKKWQENIQFRV